MQEQHAYSPVSLSMRCDYEQLEYCSRSLEGAKRQKPINLMKAVDPNSRVLLETGRVEQSV